MRWIYISPHFDDAVLSCGGLIWEQAQGGIPVEIWTVNAGDPPPGPVSGLITRVHAQWKTGTPQETVILRRNEDHAAARRVGAVVNHLNGVDAIYRRSGTGSLLYTDDVFEPVHPRESGVVEHVARLLGQGLTSYDTLICPLALGGHVDHIITRRAAEMLGRPLWYYADVPYLFNHPDELQPAVEGMTARTFHISPAGLTAWQEGIAAYASQISSLFENVEDMNAKISAYCQSRGGLTIWDRS